MKKGPSDGSMGHASTEGGTAAECPSFPSLPPLLPQVPIRPLPLLPLQVDDSELMAAECEEEGGEGEEASSVVTVLHYRPIALGAAKLPAYLQVRAGPPATAQRRGEEPGLTPPPPSTAG